MGSGKSYVGKPFAKQISLPAIIPQEEKLQEQNKKIESISTVTRVNPR